MAGSVNKAILIGNLGKDPEVRTLENGAKLARFSIATSESYTDKNTGERRDITDWHNVVLWRGLADIAEKYLTKGQKVYIEGKIKTRSWQDEAGQTKYATEVVADNMTMLSSRGEVNSAPSTSNYPSDGTPQKPNMQMPESMTNLDDDDDLPF